MYKFLMLPLTNAAAVPTHHWCLHKASKNFFLCIMHTQTLSRFLGGKSAHYPR